MIPDEYLNSRLAEFMADSTIPRYLINLVKYNDAVRGALENTFRQEWYEDKIKRQSKYISELEDKVKETTEHLRSEGVLINDIL